MQGLLLENLTWKDAEALFKEYRVAIIPLGARLKEHGLHMPLNTDWLQAEYIRDRLLERCKVLALPTLQYGYYPAFLEYPGSVSIGRETFTAVICDICESLASQGLERFYFINVGISTNWALEPARSQLAEKNILMEYTDQLCNDTNEEGTHANESETSKMLVIAPELVVMEKAKKDFQPDLGNGGLHRDPDRKSGIYSETGVWGDPTLASKAKGELLLESLVSDIEIFITKFMKDNYSPEPPRGKYLK